MEIPLWSLIPFVVVVLCMAILPTLTPDFWLKFRVPLMALLSIPVLAMSAALNYHWVLDAFTDYVSFICLLGALYSIGGGLLITGAGKANPVTNLGYLAAGAVLSNLIGTLGVSMLLIRPLMRSNRGRKHEIHVILFFIFIVSNIGGALTPLGDPPLLLGFLKGVPFWWTLKLVPHWLFAVTALLAIFAALDSYYFLQDPDFRGPTKFEVKEPLHVSGRWNLALIPLVILALILPNFIPIELELWRNVVRIGILVSVTLSSRKLTPTLISNLNAFSWEPMKEVAIIFAAIFATMIPSLKFLAAHATQLGLNTPKDFFWISGLYSGFLDSAPAYASFFAIAQALGRDALMVGLPHGGGISETLLTSISAGSVFFGALTYIGNGPNLLVKAIAEHEDIKMPSFFGYMIWSIAFVVPILFLTSVIFF